MVERNDGFVEPAGTAAYFADIADWPEHERQAFEAVTGRVLDVGAGAGRASLAAQERGMEVVALDVSPGAVEVCRRRGVEQTVLGGIEAATGTFDTFLYLGGNLGLIGSPGAAPAFFGALGALGGPEARIIGTGLDPYGTTDPDHLAFHEENRRQGRMPGELSIRIRRRLVTTGWIDLLWLSLSELAALAAPHGWHVAESWSHGPLYSVVMTSS